MKEKSVINQSMKVKAAHAEAVINSSAKTIDEKSENEDNDAEIEEEEASVEDNQSENEDTEANACKKAASINNDEAEEEGSCKARQKTTPEQTDYEFLPGQNFRKVRE